MLVLPYYAEALNRQSNLCSPSSSSFMTCHWVCVSVDIRERERERERERSYEELLQKGRQSCLVDCHIWLKLIG